MKKPIIKIAFIAMLLFVAFISFSNCSKDDNTTIAVSDNKKYFEDTVLDHDLILSSVLDNGADITSQYSKYTFRFSRTSTLSGTIMIGNTDMPLTASWTVDETYNDLTISISPARAPFIFLNDEFVFVSRTDFTLETLVKADTKIIKFSRL